MFLTSELETIDISELIRVCYVFHESTGPRLDEWLSFSADHFFIRFGFPSLDVDSWDARVPIPSHKLYLCTLCATENLQQMEKTELFLKKNKRKLWPTLDLFGGVGAFGLGVAEGSQCLKVTHAIEISPSAAQTYKFVLFVP